MEEIKDLFYAVWLFLVAVFILLLLSYGIDRSTEDYCTREEVQAIVDSTLIQIYD